MGLRLAIAALSAVIPLWVALGACNGDSSNSPEAVGFTCDATEANLPDKPRKEVAGTIAPSVPRRICTLPQEGCVSASEGTDPPAPPAPGIRVIEVTDTSIDVAYDLGSDLDDCQPELLRASVYTTISGLPPFGEEYPVSSSTGTLRIEPTEIPLDQDYGPPDILFVSSSTQAGRLSETASVGLPPPEGGGLPPSEARRIKAHREACRADIGDRTRCKLGGLHDVSGPVQGSTTEFTRQVRTSLRAHGGMRLLRLRCAGGSRCDAAFAVSGRRLEMSYRMKALAHAPKCWELTEFRVTRPIPALANLAAPLPNTGCVGQ